MVEELPERPAISADQFTRIKHHMLQMQALPFPRNIKEKCADIVTTLEHYVDNSIDPNEPEEGGEETPEEG